MYASDLGNCLGKVRSLILDCNPPCLGCYGNPTFCTACDIDQMFELESNMCICSEGYYLQNASCECKNIFEVKRVPIIVRHAIKQQHVYLVTMKVNLQMEFVFVWKAFTKTGRPDAINAWMFV